MKDQAAIARIQSLRAARARPNRAVSLGTVLAGESHSLDDRHSRLGAVGEAWLATCPADLIARTAISKVSRGVVTVAVGDASARFRIDRALREGLEGELIRASKTPIRRVKVQVVASPAVGRSGGPYRTTRQ